MSVSLAKPRIDWVDTAKGICIILVVMMHSTLGVEKAAGEISWLNGFIEWARPFRMPDFFMISGLFLASRVDRPWRQYLDTKVLHFAYFYILWMTIQLAAKSGPILADGGASALLQAWATGLVEPFGTLWFIYMLAIFFVAVKLARALPPFLVLGLGAALEMAPIATGSLLVDEFASRFVYFYAGYLFAPSIFAWAARVGAASWPAAMAGLVIWGAANTFLVSHGLAQQPGIGLALGAAGALAVVAMAVLVSKLRVAAALRHCGENSIVIYLAFFLFMAAARTVLLKTNVIADLGAVSLIVTAAGVIGPLLLHWAIRRTPLAFLFRRPVWLSIVPRKSAIAAAALRPI
jgi:uncharacterized membrane protein YcfT